LGIQLVPVLAGEGGLIMAAGNGRIGNNLSIPYSAAIRGGATPRDL
jgi:hypothetical protein